MSQMRIDYVQTALLALLAAKMEAAYGEPVQVDSLGGKDFDEDGVLVLQPPAVRVQIAGAEYQSLRDNSALTYESVLPFDVLCFQSSLRDKADERAQTLALVAAVQDQLAGARLLLADGSATAPIALKGVSLVIAEGSEVDQSFAVHIDVKGIAQFDGPNTQPGG